MKRGKIERKRMAGVTRADACNHRRNNSAWLTRRVNSWHSFVASSFLRRNINAIECVRATVARKGALYTCERNGERADVCSRVFVARRRFASYCEELPSSIIYPPTRYSRTGRLCLIRILNREVFKCWNAGRITMMNLTE